jgi:putative PEP-CTERM system integral membrane protein
VAWQAVDDREVLLTRQEVNIAEHGDWADVEIHEVYQNQTNTRKEVVYYFNLPESAVVTGLWLGPTADRSQAFVYQVAPRGAAQAVYRNEIRLNKDPALVEQIGPRQYRLRAFPVEPRPWVSPSDPPRTGPDLNLWLTYRVMAQDNAWPLPQLAEKFNVYWDGSSARLINNEPLTTDTTRWLPASIPASQPVTPAAHRMDFPNGQTVIAHPVASTGPSPSIDGLRLAVVLDRSYSMSSHAADVKEILTNLQTIANPSSEPDLYLTSSVYRGESPERIHLTSYNPDQVVYFGGQNAANLLAQFQTLETGKVYDAILVLTDDSGFELGQSDVELNVPDAPVWIVHLSGDFPLGYDDSTLEVIQASGGGVARSLQEALTRFYAARTGAGQLDVVDGYEWQTLSTSQANLTPVNLGLAQTDDAGFAALAARRVILAEMVKNKGALNQLPILDQLHQLAINNSIVTPYSSMLVLVDDRQQNLLEKLEGQVDRFQREAEIVGNTSRVNPNIITGVPEPQEWLLIVLAILALGFAYRRKLAEKPAA